MDIHMSRVVEQLLDTTEGAGTPGPLAVTQAHSYLGEGQAGVFAVNSRNELWFNGSGKNLLERTDSSQRKEKKIKKAVRNQWRSQGHTRV